MTNDDHQRNYCLSPQSYKTFSFKFHRNLFKGFWLTMSPYWCRQWHKTGVKPLSEPIKKQFHGASLDGLRWCNLVDINVKCILILIYILAHLQADFWALFQIWGQVFPDMEISIIKIRQSWDHLNFIMGIPILIRWNLYILTASWSHTDTRQLFVPCKTKDIWLIIGSCHGLSHVWRQIIIWININLSSFWSLGTNLSET